MIIFLGNGHSLDLYKAFIEEQKDTTPDIVVSCQYPFLVPKSLIDSHICVNIHYGNLPFFAGCNPVYWQLMNGDTAGVTLHYMDEKFDSGDIIDKFVFPTGNMTADEVYEALAKHGVLLLRKWFPYILKGSAPRKPQNKEWRQYYPKEDVDFSKDKYVRDLDERQLRALTFKGKQHPIIKIGQREYEIVCRNSRI